MKIVESTKTIGQVKNWFTKNAFELADFSKGKTYLSGFYNGQPTSVKLEQREGYITYSREVFGGAFIVFEFKKEQEFIRYEGYVPIWLFGIWTKKVSFKSNAGGLFKYRKEGHEWETRFREFLLAE